MPNPVDTTRRAILGLGGLRNLTEAPRAAVPAVVPESRALQALMQETPRQSVLDKPLTRRDFLDKAGQVYQGLNYLSMMPKSTGALSRLLDVPSPELSFDKAKVLSALHSMLDAPPEAGPWDFSLWEMGDNEDKQVFDLIQSWYDNGVAGLNEKEKKSATDALMNAISTHGQFDALYDDGRPKEWWRSYFEDWEVAPSADEALGGANYGLPEKTGLSLEELANITRRYSSDAEWMFESGLERMFDYAEPGWLNIVDDIADGSINSFYDTKTGRHMRYSDILGIAPETETEAGLLHKYHLAKDDEKKLSSFLGALRRDYLNRRYLPNERHAAAVERVTRALGLSDD